MSLWKKVRVFLRDPFGVHREAIAMFIEMADERMRWAARETSPSIARVWLNAADDYRYLANERRKRVYG